jgi:hypothetical protein
MKLKLIRDERGADYTYGKLYINDNYFCETIEDEERAQKVMHETAIPKGTYKIILNFSNRFQQRMPLLLNVPNFSGIRIHTGNTDDDSSGCIILGRTRGRLKGQPAVLESRVVFNELMVRLTAADKRETITITVE